MTTTVKCRAKNPATCRYHGEAVAIIPEETLIPDEDLFAKLLKQNPKIAKMEEHLIWVKKKRVELKNRYAFFNPEIVEEYDGIPYGSEVLTEYNREYDMMIQSTTPEEKEAINHYTGLGYKNVNQYLQNPEEYAPKKYNPEIIDRIVNEINMIDTVMEKNGSQERTVYRVLHQTADKKFTGSEEYAIGNGFTEGNIVHFPAYSSTTIDPNFVNRFVGENDEHTAIVLVMKTKHAGIPVGRTPTTETEMMYVQDGEREVLLPRNVSYKVTKVGRSRFNHIDPNYGSVEPLTVFLEEV